MLKLSQPNISEEGIAAVADVLRTGQLVHGPECEAFEAELAHYLDCKHVVVVSSGTAALHISLMTLDIGPGDAVVVPDFTFPATASVVSMLGAKPVIVDVEAETYSLDPELFEATVTSWRGPERLRAVIPVHEFGCPANLDQIRRIATDYGLYVVEDAACALGASYNGRKAGTLGHMGCFSFHPRKTLTTGEGGAISTNSSQFATRMRRLRNHGMERSQSGMRFFEPGLNYRLTNFQAALGRSQLTHLDDWVSARRDLAAAYSKKLKPLAERNLLAIPRWVEGHSWQTFMVVLNKSLDRAAIITALQDHGIETNLGAQSMTAIGIYDTAPEQILRGEELYRHGLALPLYELLSLDSVDKVVKALEECLS